MFDFLELDDETRSYMLEEFRKEQSAPSFPPYRPSGFVGTDEKFVTIMERALTEGDEDSLAYELSDPVLWEEYGIRIVKGRPREYRDPYDVQAKRFGITDFNTWYVRGLSAKLIQEGVEECEIYRADRAYVPRASCRGLEGAVLRTVDVYEGHRKTYHHPALDRRALSIPAGPNCHHSIQRLGGKPQ